MRVPPKKVAYLPLFKLMVLAGEGKSDPMKYMPGHMSYIFHLQMNQILITACSVKE
jgi:hypothetical protein